jgi:hypothetical protein
MHVAADVAAPGPDPPRLLRDVFHAGVGQRVRYGQPVPVVAHEAVGDRRGSKRRDLVRRRPRARVRQPPFLERLPGFLAEIRSEVAERDHLEELTHHGLLFLRERCQPRRIPIRRTQRSHQRLDCHARILGMRECVLNQPWKVVPPGLAVEKDETVERESFEIRIGRLVDRRVEGTRAIVAVQVAAATHGERGS